MSAWVHEYVSTRVRSANHEYDWVRLQRVALVQKVSIAIKFDLATDISACAMHRDKWQTKIWKIFVYSQCILQLTYLPGVTVLLLVFLFVVSGDIGALPTIKWTRPVVSLRVDTAKLCDTFCRFTSLTWYKNVIQMIHYVDTRHHTCVLINARTHTCECERSIGLLQEMRPWKTVSQMINNAHDYYGLLKVDAFVIRTAPDISRQMFADDLRNGASTFCHDNLLTRLLNCVWKPPLQACKLIKCA